MFNGDTAYITQLKQQKSKRCYYFGNTPHLTPLRKYTIYAENKNELYMLVPGGSKLDSQLCFTSVSRRITCFPGGLTPLNQRSFRKTGTMGTLASQAEIGVCARHQSPGVLLRVRVYYSRKRFEIIYEKSCNIVHFWPENCSQFRP